MPDSAVGDTRASIFTYFPNPIHANTTTGP